MIYSFELLWDWPGLQINYVNAIKNKLILPASESERTLQLIMTYLSPDIDRAYKLITYVSSFFKYYYLLINSSYMDT